MKTILKSALAGSLLATLTVAQPPQPAGTMNGRRISRTARPAEDDGTRRKPGSVVYVIANGMESVQFGVIDLGSAAPTFMPIGKNLPADVGGGGLVPGSGISLLTLTSSGNLDAINPRTGNVSPVGATGFENCSMGSDDPNCPNTIGRLDRTFYATDFANNIYSVNPKTGAAKLIGPTGIPAITFIPGSQNPDGSTNLYGESLFSVCGKLYAYFSTVAVNFGTQTFTPLIPGAIYEINPATGLATRPVPTDSNLTSIVNVNDTIYGFDAFAGQLVLVDLTNGHAEPVSEVNAGVIGGATPARRAAP